MKTTKPVNIVTLLDAYMRAHKTFEMNGYDVSGASGAHLLVRYGVIIADSRKARGVQEMRIPLYVFA